MHTRFYYKEVNRDDNSFFYIRFFPAARQYSFMQQIHNDTSIQRTLHNNLSMQAQNTAVE